MSDPTAADIAEARQIVASEECRTRGHDWLPLMEMSSPYPIGLVCQRACGVGPCKVLPPEQQP